MTCSEFLKELTDCLDDTMTPRPRRNWKIIFSGATTACRLQYHQADHRDRDSSLYELPMIFAPLSISHSDEVSGVGGS